MKSSFFQYLVIKTLRVILWHVMWPGSRTSTDEWLLNELDLAVKELKKK